jgi:hypothetical protein
LGKGVLNLTQTFNKFFKIEKQKALENTNKTVKDLDSTPSFNFVLNSMGNFKRLGNFEDQTGEKRGQFGWGSSPYSALFKEWIFGPDNNNLPSSSTNFLSIRRGTDRELACMNESLASVSVCGMSVGSYFGITTANFSNSSYSSWRTFYQTYT